MSDLVGRIVPNYLFKAPIEKVEANKIKTTKTRGRTKKRKTAPKRGGPMGKLKEWFRKKLKRGPKKEKK